MAGGGLTWNSASVGRLSGDEMKRDLTPGSKLNDAGIAVFITTIGVWIAGHFNVQIPAEVAAAITGIIGYIVAYFAPERKITIDENGTVKKRAQSSR